MQRRSWSMLRVYFCPVHSLLDAKKIWLEYTKNDLNTAHLSSKLKTLTHFLGDL